MYRFKKIEHDILKCVPSLIKKLSKDRDVLALFLFGSYAEGKQTRLSDIDLAVLLEQNYPRGHYLKKKLELLPVITSTLKTDEVDLVILNNAPCSLAYRILSRGRLIFEKEEGKNQRVSFQVRIYDQYFDFRPVERIIHEGLARRIKEGRFGG